MTGPILPYSAEENALWVKRPAVRGDGVGGGHRWPIFEPFLQDLASLSWPVRRARVERPFNIQTQMPFASVLVLVATVLGLFILFIDAPFRRWLDILGFGNRAFFGDITELGDSTWMLIVSAIVILVSLVGVSVSPLGRKFRYRLTILRQWAYLTFCTVAITGLSVSFIKHGLGRARPKFIESHGPHHFAVGEFDADFASFPSGHSTTAMTLAMLLCFAFPKYRTAWLLIGGWVCLSRVGLTAHYLSDAMAGALYGSLLTYVIVIWWTKKGALRPFYSVFR